MARQMKDSGYEWSGYVPAEWKLIPFRYVLKERQEKNSPIKSTERLSLSIDLGVTLYSEKTTNLDRFKEDFEQYKLAHSGDLVMNSMNMIVGATGVSAYYGCVSPVYYTFYDEQEDHCTTKFCEYIFKSKPMLRYLFSIGKGIYAIARGDDRVNTCRLKVSKEDLKSIIIPIPSIAEQRKIISFLDKHCAEIDAVIAKTTTTIEEYKKLKQSIITEAVTKGIRGDRPMKDSGIEWIGEMPAEWETSRIKNCFFFGKGLPITKENLVENGVSVISYGQIHSKTNTGTALNEDLFRYVSEDYIETNSSSLVSKNDFIFADTSEDLDGCGNCVFVDEETLLFAGYHTIILRSNTNTDNKYLAYLFKTDGWRSQIRSKVSGVKLFSISKKILSDTILVLPTADEQREIIEYLDKKCAEIDTLIAKKTALLEEMESYKKSVIYEYVTGKKEVVQ